MPSNLPCKFRTAGAFPRCLPAPLSYRMAGRPVTSSDYDNAQSVVETLYAHSRARLPYRLLLFGY